MSSSISICVPTLRSNFDMEQMLLEIRENTPNAEIFASCIKDSASVNRNYCLEHATGDIIIMLDDDITGFFPGWVDALIKPLLDDNSISIVSARLINTDSSPAKMMYDNKDYSPGYHAPRRNFVPSACIAFKKTNLRFDENYVGSGFEDSDFCKQIEKQMPDKHVVINNDCRLVHLNEMKNQSKHHFVNKNYYLSKWGRVR